MTSDPAPTPFDRMRHMLRTQSIPLRVAVIRMLLAEIVAVSSMIDRDRLTNRMIKLLDDIAEDFT